MSEVRAVVTAAAAIALVGCASHPTPGTTAGPNPAPSTMASSGTVSGTVKPEPISGPARVTADDLTVSVPVTWSGCEQKPVLAELETATLVRLTLTTVDRSRPGVICPHIARAGWASAVLNRPLGGRKLEDALTGAVVDHSAPSGNTPSDPG